MSLRRYENLLKPRWSKEELDILKTHSTSSTSDLKKLIPNRSRSAINQRLIKLGIRRPYMQATARTLTLTDLDLGILIGLIEGEGSIGINKPKLWKKHDKRYFRPYISVGNTDYDIISFFRKNLKLGAVSRLNRGEYRDVFQYQLIGHSAISSVLEIIIPYMLTKRKKKLAELVKEFCDRRLAMRRIGKWARYTSREKEIYKEVAELNRKVKKDIRKSTIQP